MSHTFYHADRARTLQENMTVDPDEDGYSRFGQTYKQIMTVHETDLSVAELREKNLEFVRLGSPFNGIPPSRFGSLFGALTIESAVAFAKAVLPVPDYRIPIFEVMATEFGTFDMNWVDYDSPPERAIENYRHYWYGEITNHNPRVGNRRPPMIEIAMVLPVRIGKLVGYAEPN
jgi:hypothetical protein